MNSKEIWDNLTKHEIDDRDIEERRHVRNVKVNGQWKEEEYSLHYYSWSACWRELMNRFPQAQYEFERFERDGKLYDVMYYPDGTAQVNCTVSISGVRRSMWLPVMDYKNKAIQNPDARAISDTKMRCLVKTIAMFGLGLDIYEGNYDPKEKQTEEKPTKEKEPNTEPPESATHGLHIIVYDGAEKQIAVFSDVNSWMKYVEAYYEPRHMKVESNIKYARMVLDHVQQSALPPMQKKKISNRIQKVFGELQ